ncbi:hypothetical protein MKZ38_006903 [Zalerion maritima]|uniref:Phosphatidate phosphatase APP1 catalytic domain-containing protein n=1 Tax=Zalerion maritima TaxID=339359 RepID=A0AAD5RIZ9_9PEZI|nr:hypothetical protein MKZ38_006903 [Zalerion maritima]
MSRYQLLTTATWLLLPAVLAVPTSRAQMACTAEANAPLVTPPPTLVVRDEDDEPTRVVARNVVGDYLNSVASEFGDKVSSYFFSGIPEWFQDLPTGDAVLDKLDITEDDLNAIPTSVLNLPSYANWTDEGWNLRVHGNVYKLPNVSQDKIDDLANIFLIDVDIEDLDENQQENARNLTKSIFVVQQGDLEVTMDFVSNVDVEPSSGGGTVNAQAGGDQTITLPYNTTDQGDFDVFVTLDNSTGPDGGYTTPGDETSSIQTLNVYAEGTNTGNATAYLVPPTGMTIISDIDDILRVTKIYQPDEGLLNSFARDFVPWMNMPDIYANWSASIDDFHFHYLTTTPEQATRTYMEFIYSTYPLGSFDTRPLNFSDVSATLSIRKFLLDKIFATFPQRQFILVADTTNSDVMKAYPQLAHDHPSQVQCIFLRNTSATDDSNYFPYDTSGFEGLDQDKYMFFTVPDDLTNLDIQGGKCWNESIAQNVTFGTQGLPFGLGSDDEDAAGMLEPPSVAGRIGVALLLAFLALAVL